MGEWGGVGEGEPVGEEGFLESVLICGIICMAYGNFMMGWILGPGGILGYSITSARRAFRFLSCWNWGFLGV